MNAIVTLAGFYGVTSDYLLGITENHEYHPFPVDELGMDDETIDLLKERNLNVRLICEMIKDPHFSNFLSDLEIYVDNLASAQIRNMNKYIEHNRAMIKNKYTLSDSDHYMRSLKAALIDEDNYFDNLLGNDISAIAKNLRELHKKDSNTGSDNTVFDEFMDTCEEVQKADSITQKQMLTYSKLFQMNFTKMDPYEFKTFMDIVERYSTAFKSAKGNGRGKRRENSGLPRVWIADLVCARHSLDRDLSHNSRNKMRAHITCRMGRYRSAPLVSKEYSICPYCIYHFSVIFAFSLSVDGFACSNFVNVGIFIAVPNTNAFPV